MDNFSNTSNISEKEIIFASPASVVRRILAFLIDAGVAFLPILVVIIMSTRNYDGLGYAAPALYACPVEGALSLYTVPINVYNTTNSSENELGEVRTEYNYTPFATLQRMLSVVGIVFYIGYSAFATYLYEGVTVGKHLMKIKVTSQDITDEKTKSKALLLREIIGKILINSTVIIPIISFFTMIFTEDHLTIHDMIFKTRVIE